MTRRSRTVLGFFVATLAPSLFATPLSMIHNGPVGGIALGVYAIFINAVVGYPIALIGGVPFYILAQRRQWFGRAFYVCCGLALGVGLGALASLQMVTGIQSFTYLNWSEAFALVAGGAFCGALSSLCFWLIVRPDRGETSAKTAK